MTKTYKRPKFLGYKIAAIVVAVLLWIYVMQVQNPVMEQVYTVSLETRNLAADYVLSDQNYQIQVRVQGNQQFLESATSKDIEVYADFEGLGLGQHTVKVKVILPEQLELVSVNPETVTVNVEKMQSKTFDLEAEMTGNPQDGYQALEAVLTPSQVKVSGSSYYLDSITRVYVAVSVVDLNATFHRTVTIEAVDTKGNFLTQWVTITPQFADVFIPVVSTQPEKLIPIEVDITGTPAPGYQISRIIVDPTFVTAYGDLDKLLQTLTIDTVPIDVTDAKNNINTTTDLVVDNTLTLGVDKEVMVSVQIEKTKSITFENLRIYNQNLNDWLTAKIKTETASVMVSGPQSLIDNLQESDIIPYVDCSDLQSNTYELPIKVSSPANVETKSVSPQKVTVVISKKN